MSKSYIEKYSSKPDEVLEWLQQQTNLRTNHARMLCGQVEGKLLEFISRLLNPGHILEIGTFTGYSAICLARGLKEGGTLDALELNDELEDLISEAFVKAGMEKKINLIIGNALDTLPKIDKLYDLVFIDANKREYVAYYKAVIDKVKEGGYIIADNVLWSGKVETGAHDAQTEGIQAFNEYVANDKRVENVIIPIRDGLNLIRVLEKNDYFFERASKKDIALIRKMADTSFRDTYKDILSPEQLDWMMNWMYSPDSLNFQMDHDHTYFLMYCNRSMTDAKGLYEEYEDYAIRENYIPCGYISIERQEKKLFHLQKIYLLPQFKGKGLGKALIEKGLEFVKSFEIKGCRIELNVNRKNKAIGFYQKMGFEIIESGDFEIGNGFYMNDYIMAITL